MSDHTLIKEWEQFGDIRPVFPPGFDEPVDMSQPLKVYWVPGCTGCLRMKEYLTKHGVAFVSINALADKEAFDDLARIGVKRVPIAARGKHWADGQVLRDLARLAGIRIEAEKKLPPAELVSRGNKVLSIARRFVSRIPDRELALMLPSRPRSYRQLGAHIFQIYELFLDLVEEGQRLEFKHFLHDAPAGVVTSADLERFGAAMQARFNAWWQRAGSQTDFAVKADVYYGDVTLHEFLERTIGHSAQHTRQLQVVVRKLGLQADDGLTAADLAGLPLAENEYDDKIKIA
jgi:uncharacterized damage-inducible protein DinB/glutaredoxin